MPGKLIDPEITVDNHMSKGFSPVLIHVSFFLPQFFDVLRLAGRKLKLPGKRLNKAGLQHQILFNLRKSVVHV